MKKLFVIMLSVMFVMTSALAEDFQSMTGLDVLQSKLKEGISIEKVYFTNGYGFSTSEFTTDDPEEISRLWTALNQITVSGRVEESITDWYPTIVFYLSDGTQAIVSFEANWLCIGADNYEIENADEFWELTATLVQKQEEKEKIIRAWKDTVDSSWEAASDSAITDEIRAVFEKAMNGFVGVNYVPEAYLGMQTAEEHHHAILCQATTVYPGAVPRWVIVYLSEDPDGGAAIQDIAELNW